MFDSLRGDFGYSYYGERRTSATIDIPLVVVVYTCVLISLATIVAAAGIRGKGRWYTLIRVVYSLAVGSTLLLCLFGDCWVDGIDKKVNVPYIYRSDAEITGQVGLNIGLQKINITLKGTFQGSQGSIKYNEAIPFDGAIGSVSEFRDFLERGLPQPMLTVVEFFSIDEGGFRWGRSFASAGYFAKILLLTSFSFWILANIMICSVIYYGGVLYTLTGLTMFLASIVYHCMIPTAKLRFFCSESEFHLHYGICFWSILLMGLLTTIVGTIILIMDAKMPKTIQKFFLIEAFDDTEEAYETQKNSICSMYKKNELRRQSAPALANLHNSSTDLYKATLSSVEEDTEHTQQMKRSSTNPTNLRNSYSLESLRAYSEKNSFTEISKDEKQYKSNPLFEQNEKTEQPNTDIFSKKKISSIQGRLHSAMSLESLPSIPDDKTLSFDSGMDNDEGENVHTSDLQVLNTIESDSDDNSDEHIDVSMFETRSRERTRAIQSSSKTEEKPYNNKVFTISIGNADEEEERLKEIHIDLTSAYP
ncbi:DUOXA1 [Mytilus coruscus]|uniref:DUOXA1 n=1 Tax=Mytilus coruscus TaxID=42192 RepID=A0A6J8BZX9_MYTCO|nr:DUOXA1 [Mytilus coruscus]